MPAKNIQYWEEYLTDMHNNTLKSKRVQGKIWMEGFVCGLVNAGAITDDEEGTLFDLIRELK
jgi:methionine salvage enolase-phosphatase E1